MKTIGIICAMDSEMEQIHAAFPDWVNEKVGKLNFFVINKGDKKIIAALCGVGKVNAAACAQILISNYQADYLINSGVAGSLSPNLHILDIVSADELMYHDLEERLLKTYFPYCGRYHADTKLTELVQAICAEQNVPFVTGRVVSGDQFVTDSAVKAQIIAQTQGISIEMEGAAIAHVCYLNEVPFTVIRCISDCADDNGDFDYDDFVVKAAQRCAKITLALIDRI